MLATAGSLAAQRIDRNQFLSVKFSVDGEEVSCPDLRITLRFHGHAIVPELSGHGFVVPAVFKNADQDADKVDVGVICGGYSLDFPDLHPSWVSPGDWEFGIAYPPYWFEEFSYTTSIEHGAWISYLLSECNNCDPGVYTTISHPTPPENLVTSLKREQPDASGQRARDIAYTLAVFGLDYQPNRDYLLRLLRSCLSRPKESSEDELCDSKLLSFLTNLYWRGDDELLPSLLQIADSRGDVIGQIGYFYGDLLERHTTAAVTGMSKLTLEKQRGICGLAGKYDLHIDTPKFERVAENLRSLGTVVATRCLREAESKAGATAE